MAVTSLQVLVILAGLCVVWADKEEDFTDQVRTDLCVRFLETSPVAITHTPAPSDTSNPRLFRWQFVAVHAPKRTHCPR